MDHAREKLQSLQTSCRDDTVNPDCYNGDSITFINMMKKMSKKRMQI